MDQATPTFHDIEGLDAISWWPPAVGWWLLLCLILLMIGVVAFLHYRNKRRAFKWCKQVLARLAQIEERYKANPQKECLVELSEMMKRIAIATSSRGECAALHGNAWLEWLTSHDPHQFDWQTQAQWLVDSVYAPSTPKVSPQQVAHVVQAMKAWVK